jgi:hypothetical protein
MVELLDKLPAVLVVRVDQQCPRIVRGEQPGLHRSTATLHLHGLRIHAEPGGLAKYHQPARGLRGGTRQRPTCDFLNARSHADES